MESALLYAVLFLVVLPSAIGALVLAWLHKLGFRWVLKTSKDDTPGFFKRYSIQLLYLLIISAASYFYYQHVVSEITSGKIPVPLFPATEMGLLAGVITYLIFSLVVYGLVVAGLTKLFTTFTFSESLKSQTVSLAVVALLSFGASGFLYKAFVANFLGSTYIDATDSAASVRNINERDNMSALWVPEGSEYKLPETPSHIQMVETLAGKVQINFYEGSELSRADGAENEWASMYDMFGWAVFSLDQKVFYETPYSRRDGPEKPYIGVRKIKDIDGYEYYHLQILFSMGNAVLPPEEFLVTNRREARVVEVYFDTYTTSPEYELNFDGFSLSSTQAPMELSDCDDLSDLPRSEWTPCE